MRLISRLDIKNEWVIKGINLEGLRKVGKPTDLAKKYYGMGLDEIIFIDSVASLYKRNNLFHIIKETIKNIFIPITIGGGIRSLKDISKSLENGADKIAINSYATENNFFFKKACKEFGSSTIVSYIEVKKVSSKKWEVYKYCGREKTNIELLYWINKVQELGCGEILLTSVDFEGLQKGFDFEMIDYVYKDISVPLIISGGCKNEEDIIYAKKKYKNSSFALGSALHYNTIKIQNLKYLR